MQRLLRRNVHAVAKAGFGWDSAKLYDSTRPSYSLEAVERVAFIIKQKGVLVEVGAGTGKFTRSILPALTTHSKSGIRYIASDPSEGFRLILEQETTSPAGVSLSVVEGTGEHIPIKEDHSADAVLVAQAFHWFANEAALREAHRVLKRGSPIVLVWNVLDMNIPWINDLETKVVGPYYAQPLGKPDIPRYLTMQWRAAFDSPQSRSWFGPLQTWHGGHQRLKVTRQQIVDRVQSISVIQQLDAAGQQRAADDVLELLATHPNTRLVRDGEYELVYKTEVTFAESL